MEFSRSSFTSGEQPFKAFQLDGLKLTAAPVKSYLTLRADNPGTTERNLVLPAPIRPLSLITFEANEQLTNTYFFQVKLGAEKQYTFTIREYSLQSFEFPVMVLPAGAVLGFRCLREGCLAALLFCQLVDAFDQLLFE
ncbi:MAG: hypothetical protein F6K19_51285 [Cyanothece sp. SIO1E1]|nr:hypothetical protein [Cyanothece sp. SIO1E1]